MDSLSRSTLLYHNSPAGLFLRPVRGPPPTPSPTYNRPRSMPSPSPRVPDVTEPNTGLEWFEMASSTGPSSSDHGVPSSPQVLASASIQSSPLCYFAVPSTPVQDTHKFPVSLTEDFCRAASSCTVSPLEQIVPTFGEKVPLERKCSFKSGPKPRLEMTPGKWSKGMKRQHLEIEK